MVNKKQVQRVNSILRKQIVQKYGVFAVALLVISSVAYVGTQLQKGSYAAALPATLTLSPASSTVTTGSTVAVTIVVDSSTDPVNSVQAALSYNPAQLQYVSMTEGTAFPVVAANSTATAGVIRVARGTQAPTTVSGVNNLVTVNFQVLGSTGVAAVSFDTAFSYIVRSTDNVNILSSTTGGSYTMKLPEPTVTASSPVSGPTAGGTAMTINGTGFVSGATVLVGGTPATNVVVVGPQTLTLSTPAHAAGLVNLVVTNPDQQAATRASAYTYIAPAPRVSSISPSSGTTLGGTSVTVTGTNFTTGAVVKIGGVNATSTTFVSPTSLTATTAAKAAGTNTVTVSNADGQTTSVNTAVSFTYVIPAPTIADVSPISGPTAGGTTLTITGRYMADITKVTVGGLPATSFTVINSTTLSAVTPAREAGLVDVTVSNTTGTATRTGAFTYRLPAPVVTSIAPTSGTANGGTIVTITGSNFVNGAKVSAGGSPALAVTVVSPTSITATMPVHVAGAVNLVVTNPDTQSSTLNNGFTYLAPGDANNDGRVNAIDLSVLLSRDGQNYPPADFNGDGTVGAADLAILLGRWTW